MRQVKGKHFTKAPIVLEGVYQSLYLAKPEFESLLGKSLLIDYRKYRLIPDTPKVYIDNWYHFQLKKTSIKNF